MQPLQPTNNGQYPNSQPYLSHQQPLPTATPTSNMNAGPPYQQGSYPGVPPPLYNGPSTAFLPGTQPQANPYPNPSGLSGPGPVSNPSMNAPNSYPGQQPYQPTRIDPDMVPNVVRVYFCLTNT